MYLLVPILFIVAISLYFYLKRKIKGHDFRLVNKIRPYIQFLLLVSIELAIPCASYLVYCILVNFVDEATLIGTVPSIAITLMVIALICIPIKVNHNTPSPKNSFAIYLLLQIMVLPRKATFNFTSSAYGDEIPFIGMME